MSQSNSSFLAPDEGRLLQSFLSLVQIDSPSYFEADVIQTVADILHDAGCQIEIDNSLQLTGSNSGNLIATLPATIGFEQTGRLFFSAHSDTMSPGIGIKPLLDGGVIRSSGDTVLGGDDKVGIAAIIEMVRCLTEQQLPHPEICILISVAEEVGLKGAKAMNESALGFNGEPCFVLDADGDPGSVVIGAPYQIEFQARFAGRAAHAGVSPESGVSAITMAATAIASLPWGRLDNMTTSNIGTISGGSANNVVAESCLVTGEMRSLEHDRVQAVQNQIEAAFQQVATDFGAEVSLQFDLAYHGFRLEQDDPLVQQVLSAAGKLGLPASTRYTGGGSDANIFAGKGLKPVVLSTGMTAVHSKEESLKVTDLTNLTRLLLAIVDGYTTQ